MNEVIKDVVSCAMMVGGLILGVAGITVTSQVTAERDARYAEYEATIESLGAENARLVAENVELQTEVAVRDDKIEALEQEVEWAKSLLADVSVLFGTEPVEISDEDAELLMRISMAEAGNQGTIGKALIMNTVLNRTAKYDISVYGAIYAPNQFYTAGMCEPDMESRVALELVRLGFDMSDGAIYFCSEGWNQYGDIHLFKFGDHWFSK